MDQRGKRRSRISRLKAALPILSFGELGESCGAGAQMGDTELSQGSPLGVGNVLIGMVNKEPIEESHRHGNRPEKSGNEEGAGAGGGGESSELGWDHPVG